MATFSGTELLEVAPGNPIAVCVVDDRWIVTVDAGRASPSGVLPLTGTFSVMDATTGNARAYNGLSNTNWLSSIDTTNSFTNRLCAHAGYAWFVSSNLIYRITPSTGALSTTTLASGATNGRSIVGVGDNILVGRSSGGIHVYNASTMSFITSGLEPGATVATLVPVGTDRVVVGIHGSGTIHVIDDTASNLATLDRGTSGSDKGKGFAVGRRAYMPSGLGALAIVDVDGLAILANGANISSNAVAGANLGHDGLAYMFGGSTLYGVSTVTGASETITLPTSRARRYQCVSANGQLWIPSGEPLT